MSLQQQPADDHGLSKSHSRRTRFTIDSILDTSPAGRVATDDEKTSASARSDDEHATSTERDDGIGDALLLCRETGRQPLDEEMRIDHDDAELERVDEERAAADVEEHQRSSLLARTAAEFQRRHQRRVAHQLRSFGELFLAQYQHYQRQLRNHFRHQQSSDAAVNVLRGPPPPPARGLSALDCYRPPNGLRSPRVFNEHDSSSPTEASSTSVQSRTTLSTINWSAVDERPLPLTLPCRFVRHPTSPPQSVGVHGVSETRDKISVVDYSSDRHQTHWTTSDNTAGIYKQLSLSLPCAFIHSHSAVLNDLMKMMF